MHLMRPLILLLMLLMAATGQAQPKNIEIGFTSAFNLLPSLNYAIDYYNDTRPWLDNQLGRQPLLNGYHFAFVAHDAKGKMTMRPLAWNRRWQMSIARGTTPAGEEFVRKVRSRFTTVQLLDYTYYVLCAGFGKIGGGASPIDLSFVGVKTRLNDEQWTDNEPEINKSGLIPEFYAGTTLHLDVLLGSNTDGIALIGQLYYYLNYIGEEDITWVNEAINPYTASNFPMRQTERLHHAGIKIILSL